jgi:hypothetical protein
VCRRRIVPTVDLRFCSCSVVETTLLLKPPRFSLASLGRPGHRPPVSSSLPNDGSQHRIAFILTHGNASTPIPKAKSRVRQSRSLGSVRGAAQVHDEGRPYAIPARTVVTLHRDQRLAQSARREPGQCIAVSILIYIGVNASLFDTDSLHCEHCVLSLAGVIHARNLAA